MPTAGAPALAAARTPAQQWAADQATALAPARIAQLYAAYKAAKKNPRPQAQWWGETGKRGGVRHTITGCLGEYQADKLFAAQGHKKISHGGRLCGLLDPPQGKGLDGVWRNATPPPTFLITETKTTSSPGEKPKLSKGQMTDKWIFDSDRLDDALNNEALVREIRKANRIGQVGRLLLHINSDGQLMHYPIMPNGKIGSLS